MVGEDAQADGSERCDDRRGYRKAGALALPHAVTVFVRDPHISLSSDAVRVRF
jgi:hypothetical protein